MKKFFKRFNRNVILIILVTMGAVLAGWWIYARYNQVMPQSSIYFLNDVQLPAKGQNLLVFSPHPDDETIAAGGYIHDSIQNGAKVYIVLVTDGNKHGLKDKRYQEFKTATGELGVDPSDLIFLNYADGQLQKVDKTALDSAFNQELQTIKPSIVLYPDPRDTHADHATTGEEVQKVVNEQTAKPIAYQYLVHRNRYPQPKAYKPDLYLLPPMSLVTFDREWQRYMLPSATENIKYQAVNDYKSQLKVPILRNVLLSCIRKNELFSIYNGEQ